MTGQGGASREGGSGVEAPRDAASAWDAIVVGGGPAGSAAAIRLAAAGRRVVVLERETFPRFHVGESLLPECGPVFDRLGVSDELADAGFVVKRGAVFAFEDDVSTGRMTFSRALQSTRFSTHQVERARFDQILLDAARARGAVVQQPTRATEVEICPQGVEVTALAGEGTRLRLRAPYLIDASGRLGFLAKRLELRRPDPTLENVALYAHFRGWRWPAAVAPGDTQIISRRDLGWAWVIPLAEERTSVGVVVSRERWRGLRTRERRELLDELLRSIPAVVGQMGSAERIGEPRVEADFAYAVTRYSGERWLLAGDAGSFLDPVFSTGVLLALQSGEDAGAAVDRALDSNGSLGCPFTAYDRKQRHRYEFFGRFVRAFYEPAVRDLLCRPAARFRMIEALTSVLAGHTHVSWGVRWRLGLFFLLARLQRRFRLAPWLHDRSGGGPSRSDARRPPRGVSGMGRDASSPMR